MIMRKPEKLTKTVLIEIRQKLLTKLNIVLILIFFIHKTVIVNTQFLDPTKQFNQTSSINITGYASTILQSEIDSALNINSDGLTWDVTEADVTPPFLGPTIFTTHQVESLSVTPLDSNRIILAWCDEVSKSINFKIYSTTGEVLVDIVTVDTSPGITNACDYNSVSVSALNSTHFVIAWFDASEQDVSFAIYNYLGNLNIGPIDEDTAVGTNSWGVSVSAFNSTHIVIGYYDYVDQDATFSTWNLVTQTRVAGPIDVDTAVGADSYNVHVAALNSTHFVFFYYDAGATDDATFAIYTITGNVVIAATDEDTNIGNSYSLASTVLNSSYFVLAYYDAADADITFSIYNSAGTRVVGPIDEDINVGTSGAFVSVSALNSTHFVIAYYDTVDGQHTFSIYNWNTRIVGPVDVSNVASGLKWLSVSSYLAGINLGICNQNFVFAEVNATNSARFFTYTPSGTAWNGYCSPIYQVTVEHNSTISYVGNLVSLNVSINFTSTVDDLYNMSIYDFVNSRWDSSQCQNISVTAGNYYLIWCNITTNPTNYVSGNIVAIRLNSSIDTDKGTLKEEYVQFYVGYSVGYLEVELVQPNPLTITYIIQNNTFIVNSTVYCRNAPCGDVYGTLMYNLSSPYPDTPINTSYGDKPFFVNETPAQATKACPNNPLNANDFCNLTWIINASGEINTNWKIGVLFNSSFADVEKNHTSNATISIVGCTISFTLQFSTIDFGNLLPRTYNNSAIGNSNNLYNITVNEGSCNLNLYINGTDLVNQTFNSFIKVGNISWSNISSNMDDGYFPLSYSESLIRANVPANTNVTTWYWINVPSVYAGIYKGNITIKAERSS